MRPTPELSFAIRELGCIAGINITASHNPKEYNGYKAYWEDGAQLPPEHADMISAKIREIDIFKDVRREDFDDAVASGKIRIIGGEIDEKYLDNVLAQRVNKEAIPAAAIRSGSCTRRCTGRGTGLCPRCSAGADSSICIRLKSKWRWTAIFQR